MRVLIADDHPLVIDALAEYLKRIDPDVAVVRALSFEEAIERLRDAGPIDLVLLDLCLPGVRRLDGLAKIRKLFPGIPVVMISGVADSAQVLEALDRGAAGFIPKDLSSVALIKALELVLAGERYVPSMLLSEAGLREAPAGYAAAWSSAESGVLAALTPRQHQVLSLLLHGRSNKEIARELGVKEITAAFHLKGVFKKLGVSNRTQAVATALRLGLTIEEGPDPAPYAPSRSARRRS